MPHLRQDFPPPRKFPEPPQNARRVQAPRVLHVRRKVCIPQTITGAPDQAAWRGRVGLRPVVIIFFHKFVLFLPKKLCKHVEYKYLFSGTKLTSAAGFKRHMMAHRGEKTCKSDESC